jgi:hypothetical protein
LVSKYISAMVKYLASNIADSIVPPFPSHFADKQRSLKFKIGNTVRKLLSLILRDLTDRSKE